MERERYASQFSPADAGPSRGAWWKLRLYAPAWREDQAAGQDEHLSPAGVGLEAVVLGCLALVIGLGILVANVRHLDGREAGPTAVSARTAPPEAARPDLR
jgi:hypothetical protein